MAIFQKTTKEAKTTKKQGGFAKKAIEVKPSALAHRYILRPRITEKSYALNAANQYVFEVARDAHKTVIARAIQEAFGVVVTDTGIGIPDGSLKELFRTYKQAKLSPVDKENKGTGLGLVIAKGIAEAHGGTVGAVSKQGMGTSFFFTIPLL